ncbi:hypothetical protein D3C72_1912260 [compost metagenome]
MPSRCDSGGAARSLRTHLNSALPSRYRIGPPSKALIPAKLASSGCTRASSSATALTITPPTISTWIYV